MANSSSLSMRATYSEIQITQYLSTIELPESYKDAKPSLDILTALQQHQLSHIPFENLSIHYSSHHRISLDPEFLFKKIVSRSAGRGGYCMENNCFFGTVLRTLGYEVVSVGARVHESVMEHGRDAYMGFSHMVNLVKLDGQVYTVDVGFGSDGPIRPIPLDPTHVAQGIGEQEMRVFKDGISDNTDSSQRLWIYQTRYSPAHQWKPVYCFTEQEFLPQDYEIMSYFTSTSRKSFFTQAVVVVEMIKGENDEIVGTLAMTNGSFKRRIKGNSEIVAECKSEDERVEALSNYFGIKLEPEEIEGIKGLSTQLKG